MNRDDDVVGRIESDLRGLEDRLKEYLRKDLFEAHQQTLDQRLRPLERIVYGLVGLVLLAVGSGIVALVVVP